MAEAIVSAVLRQLATIVDREVEQEVKIVVGVKKEVEKMRSTFQTIQAVLVDAENRQLKEEAVKFWLDKLKHISYDIDDVLDEWNTALLKSKIERDQGHKTPSTPSLLSKVRSCIPSPCFCYGGVALRRDTAIKIKELNERLQAISKGKDDFAFLVDLTRNKNIDLEIERPKTTNFVDVSAIRGRDQDKRTVISMLVSENNHEERGIPIISIVGMGGIGKTTLAQMVYNHHELNAYFQKKIWVCVSDPFDEMRIAKAILEALMGFASSLNELNSVLKEIHESIMGRRYLLVLDDVWNEDEQKWQSLKNCLQSGSKGSKILVTTRKENVATIMGCTDQFLHLGKLSEEECWSLLSQIALSGRNDRERESMEDIVEKIAYKCHGLPLAVKTLGGLLRFKRTREQWQRILNSHLWELDEVEKGLFSPLLLSYYDLPSRLRQCFSYCAIFPKDHIIEKDLLIKLWMAQGFLGETQGNEMEIIGEEYFDNLAIRSFFQEFEKDADDDSIIVRCKIHDIVHDFARLLRKTECCEVASNGIEEQRADFYHGNVRHLTFIPGNKDVGIPDATYNVKKVRSLLLVESWYCNTSSLEASLQLTCLRMLNLSGTQIKELPQEIGKLIHLRYLNIERNEELDELPEALCELCNLQTLNVRWCHELQKLPRGMEKLINLRHLQNKHTSMLVMPKGMQRLTCLRTLEKYFVEKKRDGIKSEPSFRLEDFGKLIHLGGHLEISGLANVGEGSEAREARLSTKVGLQKLTLNFDGGYYDEQPRMIENEAFVIEALQPPQLLQVLGIGYCKGPAFPFPNWMMSLTVLKSVELRWCENWESLPPMGKLPSLESLIVLGNRKVKKVGEEFVGVETSSSSSSVNHNIAFPNLKTLKFDTMVGWEEWEYEKVLRSRGEDGSSSSNITIMPKLQCLVIERCPKLKTLPLHLLQSRALQELVIEKSAILYRRFNKETGNDWPSISHIPNVHIIR